MKNKINSFIDNVRDEAFNLKEAAKARLELNRAASELSSLFRELGEAAYAARLGSEQDHEDMDRLCTLIDAKQAVLKSLRREYNALNGRIECDACGRVTSCEYDFCPFCGAKLFETVYADEVEDDAISPDDAEELADTEGAGEIRRVCTLDPDLADEILDAADQMAAEDAGAHPAEDAGAHPAEDAGGNDSNDDGNDDNDDDDEDNDDDDCGIEVEIHLEDDGEDNL